MKNFCEICYKKETTQSINGKCCVLEICNTCVQKDLVTDIYGFQWEIKSGIHKPA